jgi:hypothetical protein
VAVKICNDRLEHLQGDTNRQPDIVIAKHGRASARSRFQHFPGTSIWTKRKMYGHVLAPALVEFSRPYGILNAELLIYIISTLRC